jgi:predicted O-methyltransferase YrrM
MLKNPIIIAAPPRSGTTMVAGLLKKHGVWVGNARVTRYPGTNSIIATENQNIKDLMKIMARSFDYQNWNKGFPVISLEDAENWGCWLRSEIKKIVPDNTIWLIKTAWTLIFYDIWKAAFPDAKWIIIDRRTNDIVASALRHPAMKRRGMKKIKQYVRALKKKQSLVWDELGIKQVHYVYADALASGDMGTAGSLLTFCKITFNPKITRNFIKPEIYHKSARQGGIPYPVEGGKRFLWLARMINKRNHTLGAEIGCARGKTTKNLLKKCPNLSLLAVDLWGYAPSGNGGTQYKQWDFDSIYECFKKNIASHNGRLKIIRGLSWEVASRIDNESLDFVFIDADHEYESVKKDILAWTPKLKTGGTLCGHDTHFSGVKQALQELIPHHKLVGIDHLWECKKEDVINA